MSPGEALVPSIVRLFVNRKQLLISEVSKIVGAKSSVPLLLYQAGSSERQMPE